MTKKLSENELYKKICVSEIHRALRKRIIHPTGEFDKRGRWYSINPDLISVRNPSTAFPLSQMIACRSKKYVAKVMEKYRCENLHQLMMAV